MATAQAPLVTPAEPVAPRRTKRSRDRAQASMLVRVILAIICVAWLIPLVGTLFTAEHTNRQKRDLYIVVTPHIVHGTGEAEAAVSVTTAPAK